MRFKSHLLIILLLLCLTVVFFREVIIGDKILVTTDFLFFNLLPWSYYKPSDLNITGLSYHLDVILEFCPLLYYVSEQIKSQKMPLWNPYICSGLPIIAQPHVNIFSPINSLLFYFFPTTLAFGYCAVIHVFLMGLFIYLFLTSININKTSALVGAIVFMFNGTTICLLFPDAITTLCWLPAVLYLYEKSLKKKDYIHTCLGGLFLGIAFLTGEVRFAAYIGIFLLLYSIFRISFISIRKENKNIQYAVYSLGLIYFIGIMIGSVLLFPLFELLPFSSRLYATVVPPNLNLSIGKFVSAFINSTIIKEPEFSIMLYVGFPVVFLTLFSLLRRDKSSLFFWVTIVIFYLSTNNYIMNKIFSKIIPVFKIIRFEQEVMFPVINFSVAILAAIGSDTIFRNRLFKQTKNLLLSKFLTILKIFIIAAVAINLFVVGRKKITTLLGNTKYCYFRTQATDFLTSDKELYRIIRMASEIPPHHYYDDILPSNTQMMYGIYDAQGYLSFLLHRYGEFMSLIESDVYENETGDTFISGIKNVESLNSKLIDLANIKYVLSDRIIKNDKFRLVYDKEFRIYENRNVLARAFLVLKPKVIKDTRAILRYMQSSEFDPATEVILEKEPTPDYRNEISISPYYRIQFEKYEPDEVTLSINADQDGWLVLSDTYYPGWKAYIDNKPTQIYRANYVFRAIAINKGLHKIKFIYSPFSFKIGFFISICTLIIVLIFVMWRLFRITILVS